jgi:hypothetical protein
MDFVGVDIRKSMWVCLVVLVVLMGGELELKLRGFQRFHSRVEIIGRKDLKKPGNVK